MPWAGKGLSLTNKMRLNEAIHCFDKAIDLDPNYSDAWAGKGLATHMKDVFEESDHFNEAISFFDTAIELDPNNSNAWAGKGMLLELIGRKYEAQGCYEKSMGVKC